MPNDNQQPNNAPRRSIFSYILPYLLVGLAIAGLITLIVMLNSNNSDSWAYSRLDECLSTYVIKNATVSQNEKATTITGTYLPDATNNPNNERSFSVVLDNEVYNNDFVVTEASDGYTYTITSGSDTIIYHYSYHTLFLNEINEYQTLFQTTSGSYLVINDLYQADFWSTWGPTIIIVGVGVLLMIILFSGLSRSVNSSNNKALDFNRSRARRVDTSKVKFADVAGCDEEKAEMVEVVQYLKEPKKFSKFGAKLPKGILLIGPPGCGKTLLAKAVAGEAGVPFYSISGSDFVEMFVGVGAGRVRDMFRKAKQNAPCLIFIDEIDAVGRQRGAGLGGGNDEREQTLNQLLVEMDGFSDNSGIIVIAATNREDVLDPALLRAGRFDRTITVNLPDRKGREAIFKVHARGKTIDPEVNFESLSRRTVGFSGADIENILNEAAILAVRENKDRIDMKDIDEAIDRRIAGPAKSSRGLSDSERKRVAYHEAGHAIIGLKLKNSDKVQKITIIPRGRTGGHVLMTPEEDRFLLSQPELEARIVGYLGGRSSEEVFFKDVSTGAQNDIEVATRIARLMVTEYGMSTLGPIQYEKDSGSVFLGRDYTSTQRNFSTQVAYEIDKEVRKIIDEAHTKAIEIITKYKKEVTLIAETLLENETITADEIDYLLTHGNLPSKVVEAPIAEAQEEVKKVEEQIAEDLANGSENETKPKVKRASKKTSPAKKKDE